MSKLDRILEADLTEDEILKKLDSLRIPKVDDVEDARKDGKTYYSKSFRAWDFFRNRPGEEDDDWPEFVELDKVVKIVNAHFKDWIKEKKVKVGSGS